MMNMQPTQPTYVALAGRLRAQGVGVYTVNSEEVKIQPQGGRWFHVLPLLRTGARLLLSDSDAVWLRNPLPYLRLLEATHPLLDFAVCAPPSAAGPTPGLSRGQRRPRQWLTRSHPTLAQRPTPRTAPTRARSPPTTTARSGKGRGAAARGAARGAAAGVAGPRSGRRTAGWTWTSRTTARAGRA